MEKSGVALVGDRAREAGLAGAGRAVKQNALGRVDAEALEQFGMAQRQFYHLTQRVDRIRHPAEIVVGDVGAALSSALDELGPHLDLGVLVDVNDAARSSVDHGQAHFLEGERGRVEQLPDMLGHIGIDSLMARGCDHVAFGQGTAFEAPLQCSSRTLQTNIALCGCEHDPSGRLGHGFLDFDEVARPDPGIGALEPIEADDVEAGVVAIGADGARRGRAFSDDLDDIALGKLQRFHQLDREARDASAAVPGGKIGHLKPGRFGFGVRHA